MSAQAQDAACPDAVLAKAVFRSAKQLGLNNEGLAKVLGVHRTKISRIKSAGTLDHLSKEGELAKMLIRTSRAMYALTGGDEEWMAHFMSTPNRVTGGVPREQIETITGLVSVMQFLDAVRGKV